MTIIKSVQVVFIGESISYNNYLPSNLVRLLMFQYDLILVNLHKALIHHKKLRKVGCFSTNNL